MTCLLLTDGGTCQFCMDRFRLPAVRQQAPNWANRRSAFWVWC